MHYLPILAQIAVIYLIAAASPGPNFFMITQLSLAGRRSLGAASALGVCTASMIWVTLAMLGLAAVLQRLEWLYSGVRIAGVRPIRGGLRTRGDRHAAWLVGVPGRRDRSA